MATGCQWGSSRVPRSTMSSASETLRWTCSSTCPRPAFDRSSTTSGRWLVLPFGSKLDLRAGLDRGQPAATPPTPPWRSPASACGSGWRRSSPTINTAATSSSRSMSRVCRRTWSTSTTLRRRTGTSCCGRARTARSSSVTSSSTTTGRVGAPVTCPPGCTSPRSGPTAFKYEDEIADWLEANPSVRLAFRPGTHQLEAGSAPPGRGSSSASELLVADRGGRPGPDRLARRRQPRPCRRHRWRSESRRLVLTRRDGGALAPPTPAHRYDVPAVPRHDARCTSARRRRCLRGHGRRRA